MSPNGAESRGRCPIGAAGSRASDTTDAAFLRTIKTVHTLVWGFFAAAIVAIPIAAALRRFDWVVGLAAVVSVEIVVLALNDLRCPLTDVAARHTTDRRANFDIYLPLWLAERNKQVFGTLFVAGLLFSAMRAVAG